MQAISIGEVLWDVLDEAEHLGGAPFNFAVHLQNLQHSVHFISAVGADTRGKQVRDQMQAMGLETGLVPALPDFPTGTASVALDSQGQPRFVINHPAAYDFPALSDSELAHLSALRPNLIYFGTLFQMSPQARQLTRRLLEACPSARRFYDVNLRANSYQPALVQELMSLANLVKVNDEEVETISAMLSRPSKSLEHFCRDNAQRYGWSAVCVTRGPAGCVALIEGKYVASPGYAVSVADTIGAGDAFAAAFAHGFVTGWEAGRIADFANRVGALVASRTGATPVWSLEEAAALRT